MKDGFIFLELRQDFLLYWPMNFLSLQFPMHHTIIARVLLDPFNSKISLFSRADDFVRG